jgi:hypothetical protein
MSLFVGDNEEMLWVKKNVVSKQIKQIRKLYEDFSVVRDGRYGCPITFNRLTMAWYLNEPVKAGLPNVACGENYDFAALRDINVGEELTVDYSTYSDAPTRKRTHSRRRRSRS